MGIYKTEECYLPEEQWDWIVGWQFSVGSCKVQSSKLKVCPVVASAPPDWAERAGSATGWSFRRWSVVEIEASYKWTVNSNQWALSSGQWSVNSGKWAVAVGRKQLAINNKQWTVVSWNWKVISSVRVKCQEAFCIENAWWRVGSFSEQWTVGRLKFNVQG
jgi:hypothetical protein